MNSRSAPVRWAWTPEARLSLSPGIMPSMVRVMAEAQGSWTGAERRAALGDVRERGRPHYRRAEIPKEPS